jgi:hypothetical protein
MAAEEALRDLGVDLATGLSQTEAARRLQTYGPNVIEERSELVAQQLWPLALIAAASLTAAGWLFRNRLE